VAEKAVVGATTKEAREKLEAAASIAEADAKTKRIEIALKKKQLIERNTLAKYEKRTMEDLMHTVASAKTEEKRI